jgi:hypothetical protein
MDALQVQDYRPISLIHSFAQLVTNLNQPACSFAPEPGVCQPECLC